MMRLKMMTSIVAPVSSFQVGHVTFIISARTSRKYCINFCIITFFFKTGLEGIEPPTNGFGDRYSTN
jgi:hypothetical protein